MRLGRIVPAMWGIAKRGRPEQGEHSESDAALPLLNTVNNYPRATGPVKIPPGARPAPIMEVTMQLGRVVASMRGDRKEGGVRARRTQ